MDPRPWRARPVLALLLGITAFMLEPVAAQSAGQTKRQEREKRAKPAKVYTDADLEAKRSSRPDREPALPIPSDGLESTPRDPKAAPDAKPRDDETAERKRLEADWRVRFADARGKIAEAELRCWHSVVRTVFVAGIPVQQWVKEFAESEEFRQAKRALLDLEEEFRKTGLPPGWTRE